MQTPPLSPDPALDATRLFNQPRRRRTRLPLERGGPQGLVPRERLLRAVLAQPVLLTLVQAPAGYGKTVLLAQCHAELSQRGIAAPWLSLDPLDREPAHLLLRLLGALHDAGIACELDPHEPAALDPETAGSELADVLAALAVPVVLFIDSADAIAATPSQQLLAALVRRAPGNLRLVMSSRAQIALAFARLRASDQLRELTVQDLRFQPAETAAFFSGADALPAEACNELHERCEGWAGGLTMVRRLLRNGLAVEHIADSITGDRQELAEFFDQEVVPHGEGGAPLRRFLQQVCLLRSMTAELCDALTDGEDGRSQLRSAMVEGRFVFTVDPQQRWFRLHGLFAEFLRRQLKEADPARWRELHRRASAWYVDKRMFIDAIDHALEAGEPLRAAEIFDLEILESWCSGSFGSPQVEVLTLCGRLPMDVKMRFPRILLLEAWRRDVHWQFEGARDLLQMTRRLMAESDGSGAAADSGLQGLLLHGEMMLSCVTDDMPQAEAQVEALLRDYPQANPYVRGSFYISLLQSQREQFKLAQIDRLSALARECLSRSEVGPGSVFAEAVFGPSFFMAGRLSSAVRSLNDGLKLAKRFGGGGGALGSIVALPLAEVLYERNELEAARALLAEYLPHGTVHGFVDQLIGGWTTQSRLLQLAGDDTGAMAALDDALFFARTHCFERLRLVAAGEQIRLQLGLGRLHEAKRIAREHGIQGDAKSQLPGKAVTTRDEARALAWVRLALADNRIADGMGVAKHWRNFVEAAGAIRSVVRWDIAMAHLQRVDGDQRAAQRLLRRAVDVAATGRFVRSFLDEGAWVETLLRKQEDHGGGDETGDSFTAELLRSFDAQRGGRLAPPPVQQPEADSGVYGALSSREVEIMTLVSAGLLNREIGDKLGMTEGSVKWYLQRIYDKLGVRRRAQAMDKAVKMGIISG